MTRRSALWFLFSFRGANCFDNGLFHAHDEIAVFENRVRRAVNEPGFCNRAGRGGCFIDSFVPDR